ncbi:DinB family protein [Gracilibacillus kekensis]|uniref:DinB superfamily protein n=1 Tax=Gracilibacillus kekensis TaxID=1027249 RepID=A0A1M7NN00_9BACI|nr:DinB family protein [Gracilibacillus kekensis]SHN05287.1 DinB superfamily protein [Gracilibacillus kekensis]
MQSLYMKNHFNKIYQQREEFQGVLKKYKNKEWERPVEGKWSFGETYYHLYLMVKRFRQLNKIYVPIYKPIATIRRRASYKTEIHDIYAEYKQNNKQPMKAPSVLLPPKGIQDKITFEEIIINLEKETHILEEGLADIPADIAGHIRYPDPIAYYPNLIQSIKLIGIHEEHHFNLCKKYYQ